jgi:uncharacterized membrane protein YfcA
MMIFAILMLIAFLYMFVRQYETRGTEKISQDGVITLAVWIGVLGQGINRQGYPGVSCLAYLLAFSIGLAAFIPKIKPKNSQFTTTEPPPKPPKPNKPNK